LNASSGGRRLGIQHDQRGVQLFCQSTTIGAQLFGQSITIGFQLFSQSSTRNFHGACTNFGHKLQRIGFRNPRKAFLSSDGPAPQGVEVFLYIDCIQNAEAPGA
jgi:hypothetical protein